MIKQVSILFTLVVLTAGGAVPRQPLRMETRELRNCEVPGTPLAIFEEGKIEPETIVIGNSATLTASLRNIQSLPNDLQLSLNITKVEPNFLQVPCLDTGAGIGLGSCTYDVCPLLASNDLVCGLFPPSLPCQCPLIQGSFSLNPITVQVPNLGDIISILMEGNYVGRAVMYSKANEANPVGCLEFTFALARP